MKENLITNSISAAKEALKLRFYFERQYLWPKDQLSLLENLIQEMYKAKITIKTLAPWELKKWVRWAASVNYGRSLLNEVFPVSENPKNLESDPEGGVIVIGEHLNQKLGWKDVEELKEKAVRELGLSARYIDWGFEKQATERGIDLEWHFFAVPPGENIGGRIPDGHEVRTQASLPPKLSGS